MTCLFESSGVGLGWRPETAWLIEQRSTLAFTEVVAETIRPAAVPGAILRLRDRGLPIVPHGVSLSLGGARPPESGKLDHLARLAERLGSPCVSEHIAFVRSEGIEAGHLLPTPRTRETLDIVVENVREAMRALPVPLVLENIATLFEWPSSELDEPTFLSELLERTGAFLLLDLANLHANSRNHDYSATDFLERIPLERVAYVHVAGGIKKGSLYHDTHAHPVSVGALALLRALAERGVGVPTLLERDDAFGTRPELERELDAIEAARAPGESYRVA